MLMASLHIGNALGQKQASYKECSFLKVKTQDLINER